MPAQVSGSSNGILTMEVSGRLSEGELAAAQSQVGEFVRKQGKVRILVLVHAFEGWERGGEWDDAEYQAQTDPHVEKMAIVGEQRWEDLALLFVSQGLRPFPIEYFRTGELVQARNWLSAR